jgi:signal transduction histidine kinase
VSSVKAALVVGFALVFVLWLFWGYQLVRSLVRMEQTLASAQDSYARGEQVLLRIRTNVLLGSIYLRDALIDRSSPRREYYRTELDRLRDQGDVLVEAYVPEVASPAEREQWRRLQQELQEYWQSREVPFADETRSTLESAAVLRNQVVPRRESVLEIVDRLSSLQAAAKDRHQREVDRLFTEVTGRLAGLGAGTLVGALLVAVAASRHAHGLQRQVERQRRSEQENRRDLERLSARLVDVQEQERRHLARELHDAVGQALTAVKMDIGIALRADAGPRVRAALEEAREITETTLRGVRDLSQLLHPSTLDDFGLPATLTAYLRSFSDRTNIRAQLAETLDERLPPQVEVCVYRIVQEAMNNIATHSGATGCMVSVSAGDGALRLVIDDNGRGPATTRDAVLSARGLGLIAMRERAQTLGGTFAIESSPSGGMRVSVSLPLRTAARAGPPVPEIGALEADHVAG